MTDAQFAQQIDFTSLTKAQLLTLAGEVAKQAETWPPEFNAAVDSGLLTREQACVLKALRVVKGDPYVNDLVIGLNLDGPTAALAIQVRDWLATHAGATSAEIKAQFPAVTKELMQYLLAAGQIKQGFKV